MAGKKRLVPGEKKRVQYLIRRYVLTVEYSTDDRLMVIVDPFRSHRTAVACPPVDHLECD